MSDTEKPAVPPPRYEEGEGHHRLIMDDQEWLARPASWGIEVLPEEVRWRKSRLYECHLRDRLAVYVRCDLCRPRITELYPEYEEGRFVEVEVFDIRKWYIATHPEGQPRCDGWQILKAGVQYQRGIVCPSEARNVIIDRLFGLLHSAPHTPDRIEGRATMNAWQRAVALDLVGPNPFRPVAFDPAWRTDTVVALAKGMYESRDFSAMPILADALQDVGCDNDDILNHCRDEKQVHVRGCWVVDLVLGKS